MMMMTIIQDFLGGNISILGDHSIGLSTQKYVYVDVSYSERFPRQSYFAVQTSTTPHELRSALMSIEFSKMYYNT
jgi:hypothetical protein